jgi:hypothetical protein
VQRFQSQIGDLGLKLKLSEFKLNAFGSHRIHKNVFFKRSMFFGIVVAWIHVHGYTQYSFKNTFMNWIIEIIEDRGDLAQAQLRIITIIRSRDMHIIFGSGTSNKPSS